MEQIKIVLVDDHSLVRDAIKAMLSTQSDMSVIAESWRCEQIVNSESLEEADVIIMDIIMPGMSGIEATKLIKEKYPDIKILLLSMEVNAELVSKGISAGANGYLTKDARKSVLIEAIHSIHKGGKYFNSKISEIVFENFYSQSLNNSNRLINSDGNAISEREKEVLKLLAEGHSNRETADQLFISVRTVDSHRNHIMKKLRVKNTAELVKYALKHEIISLD
ncbi:MAG: response regulator transcription factor [Bacteroidota bacterium]